ncbi:hypothetical protein CBM2599_B50169 [Cupriavidus taiwanensis]|nr:hypothetical protein CBM2600_B10819 [Cupriavidus taiwanensis]SOY96182.1 hypothetical protein CBM2599_B50169 [Cupriavidus taiwanensis]
MHLPAAHVPDWPAACASWDHHAFCMLLIRARRDGAGPGGTEYACRSGQALPQPSPDRRRD